MSNDSTKKMIIVALGVCLVCSVFVSTAAVSLHARQEQNKELDKLKNILVAGDLMVDGGDIQKIFQEKIEIGLVELQKGDYVAEDQYNEKLNPNDFDMKDMADHSEYGMAIPAEKDIAHILRMPKYMPIYAVKVNGIIEKYILPIYGKGLWSTMYGFLALAADLETIEGITFNEHGETPGLGGEIDNPKWKAIWKGKKAFDKDGNVKITVIKGIVDPSDASAIYQVDGLSGATITTRGLDATTKFWLSKDGYGPFIQQCKIQKEGINEQG